MFRRQNFTEHTPLFFSSFILLPQPHLQRFSLSLGVNLIKLSHYGLRTQLLLRPRIEIYMYACMYWLQLWWYIFDNIISCVTCKKEGLNVHTKTGIFLVFCWDCFLFFQQQANFLRTNTYHLWPYVLEQLSGKEMNPPHLLKSHIRIYALLWFDSSRFLSFYFSVKSTSVREDNWPACVKQVSVREWAHRYNKRSCVDLTEN